MIIFDILYRTFFDFLNNKLKRGKREVNLFNNAIYNPK